MRRADRHDAARDFVGGCAAPTPPTYLQAMVSNDVEALAVGDACEALLLTAKARVIAPLVVLAARRRRLPPPDRAGARRARPLDAPPLPVRREVRDRAEEHTSSLVLGGGDGIPTTATTACRPSRSSTTAVEPTIDEDELELLRIRAGTPRFGREIDDRVLPAEAGLEERAVDFEKGCYPGQEPIARLHYRGTRNRTLRVLEIDGERAARLRRRARLEGKDVGRVTSAARDGDGVVALAYVRVEVPRDAELDVGARVGDAARLAVPAPVAQGIERCPAEAEAASSNLAGRIPPALSGWARRARRGAGPCRRGRIRGDQPDPRWMEPIPPGTAA